MKIIVLGKIGCLNCEKAKERLTEMGLKFDFYSIEEAQAGWRDSNISKAMVEYQMTQKLPIIMIDGESYSYAKGINQAKKGLKNGK